MPFGIASDPVATPFFTGSVFIVSNGPEGEKAPLAVTVPVALEGEISAVNVSVFPAAIFVADTLSLIVVAVFLVSRCEAIDAMGWRARTDKISRAKIANGFRVCRRDLTALTEEDGRVYSGLAGAKLKMRMVVVSPR